MSRVVIVEINKAGKIELSKDQLQKMLDDAYDAGYTDGSRSRWTTWPSYPITYANAESDPSTVTSAGYKANVYEIEAHLAQK